MAEQIQYVTLGVAEEIFAAPVATVQEILDMLPIARLPRAPENLLGMIDVRDKGVPVLDLRLTLGMAPAVSSGWSGHCIAGIGRRNGSFVTVLDLDGLFGDIVKQPILAA